MIETDRDRQEDDRGPARRRGAEGLDWIARAPELFPALACVAILVFWATAQGGTAPTDWYPGTLFLLGVLAATVYAFRADIYALPQLHVAALVLLGAFALWNFASIAWADDQGAAWDGANRCLLYLTVFALFVIPPWRPGAAAILFGAFTVAITLIGATVFYKAAHSSDALQYFIGGRFSEPTGYHNANSALFTMALFPAIFLAARRETPWPVRGLMLACAGVLFHLALMPQSRGWLIAAPIAFIAYLVIVPGLARTLTVLVPLAAVLALGASPILHVFDISDDLAEFGPALDDAWSTIAISALALFVIGSAIGYLDRRLEVQPGTARLGTRVAYGATALGALAGVVVALAVIGNPVDWVDARWQDFKAGKFDYQTGGGSRLGQGLGSNRYDFWRVAADEFTSAPIVGVGSENFAEDYVRDRRSPEEPTYPHNLQLQIVSETGLIGGLLFGGFLAVSLVGLARVRLRASPLARGVAAVSAVVFIYWFVHGIGDWFWAFAAVSAPVFAWLGLGMRLDADRTAAAHPARKRWVLPAGVAGAAVAVVAAVSLILPWASAVDVERARESWGADPAAAFDRLDQARDLNILSARPDLVAGAIASQLDDRARMRSAFERALERQPRNWYALLELAALDTIEGDSRSALRLLDRVAELNPREELTAKVRKGVVGGKPLSLQELDAAFVERYCSRIGRDPAPDGGCE